MLSNLYFNYVLLYLFIKNEFLKDYCVRKRGRYEVFRDVFSLFFIIEYSININIF